MSGNLKILLSPTKTMNDYVNTSSLKKSYPEYLKESFVLIQKLRKIKVEHLMVTMSISLKLAEQNYKRFNNWEFPEKNSKNWYVSADLYSGEAYKALDYQSLNEQEKIFAHQHLFILSGLYGIIKSNDLIYPYRLEMGLKWFISDEYPTLYKYWEDKITFFINKNIDSNSIIINLASNEYFKVIKRKEIKSPIITPTFKTLKNGHFKTIAIHSKLARGLMTRFIIKNKISSIDELKKFNDGGYCYNDSLSNSNELLFTKE